MQLVDVMAVCTSVPVNIGAVVSVDVVLLDVDPSEYSLIVEKPSILPPSCYLFAN